MPQSLKTVLELEKLWDALQHKPLYAPPHFFRYLKLRWRMRLQLLDPNKIPISAPLGQINDCQSCTDICCVGPRSTVLLRLKDIATLMDIGRTDLITQQKPLFSHDELQKRPALKRQTSSQAWQIFPVLKQNNFGACAALTTHGKCSLYPYWPMACARFPYALHLEDLDVFYSSRCESFWIHPQAKEKAEAMKVAAVASYNERIKDAILLSYAREKLQDLGLLQYLKTPS